MHQVPTKCVASTQNFAVKCGVQFIDFEGRTDGKHTNWIDQIQQINFHILIILGESIFKLLQQLRPRRAILVRGSQQSLNSLRDFCSEVSRSIIWIKNKKVLSFSRFSPSMAVSGVNVRDINFGRARILGDDIMPPRRRRFLHFQTIMS